jgi:hypothetical protein
MQSPDLISHVKRWHETHLGYAKAARDTGNELLFDFHADLVDHILKTLLRLQTVSISQGGAVSPPIITTKET